MANYAINLKTASYDAAGIVSATWDLLTLNGNAGFYVRVDWTQGLQAFYVRDAATVSVSFPMQFDAKFKTYTMTVYGLLDADDPNPDVYSQPLNISGWPLS